MDIIGPKDIAAKLGISERNATRLLKNGDIPGFRAGVKPWRSTELHLESYVRRRLLEQSGSLPAAEQSPPEDSSSPPTRSSYLPQAA